MVGCGAAQALPLYWYTQKTHAPRTHRTQALAAQAVKVEAQVETIPEIKVDLFGAVSPASADDVHEGVFKCVAAREPPCGRACPAQGATPWQPPRGRRRRCVQTALGQVLARHGQARKVLPTHPQNHTRNVDGHRFEDGRYAAFTTEITSFIPKERQFTDPVRTLAYGTDASFYRLNPKMVVKVRQRPPAHTARRRCRRPTRCLCASSALPSGGRPAHAAHASKPSALQVHNEAEVRRILPIAQRHGVPVTFRAAGTSLSGQAITDSVLLKLSHTGKNFRNFTIHVNPGPGNGWAARLPQNNVHAA